MTGRKGRHAAPVEWNRAISLAGSVVRLTDGIKEKTWKHWENTNEVPAYRVLPILIERVERELTAGIHDCDFLNFASDIDQFTYMRRAVLALMPGDDERKKAEKVLTEARRLKKLEANR